MKGARKTGLPPPGLEKRNNAPLLDRKSDNLLYSRKAIPVFVARRRIAEQVTA